MLMQEEAQAQLWEAVMIKIIDAAVLDQSKTDDLLEPKPDVQTWQRILASLVPMFTSEGRKKGNAEWRAQEGQGTFWAFWKQLRARGEVRARLEEMQPEADARWQEQVERDRKMQEEAQAQFWERVRAIEPVVETARQEAEAQFWERVRAAEPVVETTRQAADAQWEEQVKPGRRVMIKISSPDEEISRKKPSKGAQRQVQAEAGRLRLLRDVDDFLRSGQNLTMGMEGIFVPQIVQWDFKRMRTAINVMPALLSCHRICKNFT